jgi:hypothetical protein
VSIHTESPSGIRKKPLKHSNSSSFKVLYECLIEIQCESKQAAIKSDIPSETELCLTGVVLCVNVVHKGMTQNK